MHTGTFGEANTLKIRRISEYGHGGTCVRAIGKKKEGERGEKYK
jgi:hypothetical protein